MEDTRNALSSWLGQVIDELKLHSRAEWGEVLGVSEQVIEHWIVDKNLPSADKLRSIVVLLRERYPKHAQRELETWSSLSEQSLQETAQTLGTYIVQPLWTDLRMAVASLPAHRQEEFLGQLLRQVNQHRSATAGET